MNIVKSLAIAILTITMAIPTSGATIRDEKNKAALRKVFEENKIEDSGDVNTGIQHVDGYCNTELIVLFKFQNQIIAITYGIVHQLACVRRICRV